MLNTPENEGSQTQLKGKELDQVVEQLANEKSIKPSLIRKFLEVDTESKEILPTSDKIILIISFALYVVTFAWNKVSPETITIDQVNTLQQWGHAILEAFWNMSVNSAEFTTLKAHLPFLFLTAGVGYPVIKNSFSLHFNKGREEQRNLQEETEEALIRGEMPFKMNEGFTAAFVGDGDFLGDLLQDSEGADNVMLLADSILPRRFFSKVDQWQLGRDEDVRNTFLFEALDRLNFRDAGEVLMMPVKDNEMFLPDPKTGHDISQDDLLSRLGIIDLYCEEEGIPKKKIIIVGNKGMSQVYESMSEGREEIDQINKTLEELVDELNEERKSTGSPLVEIVDPTDLVMEKLIEIVGDKRIKFQSTEEGFSQYGQRFFGNLKKHRGDSSDLSEEEVLVLYDISDEPTEAQVHPEDIAIILDPSRKAILEARGVLPENIISVPDLVNDHLKVATN